MLAIGRVVVVAATIAQAVGHRVDARSLVRDPQRVSILGSSFQGAEQRQLTGNPVHNPPWDPTGGNDPDGSGHGSEKVVDAATSGVEASTDHVPRPNVDRPLDASQTSISIFQAPAKYLWHLVVSTVVALIIVVLCAVAYRHFKIDGRVPTSEVAAIQNNPIMLNGMWQFPLFDCMSSPNICCISCICPCIRWADTIRMTGIMTFWTALIFMSLPFVLSPVSGSISLLVVALLGTYQRQALRRIFGMPTGEGIVLCEDCCTWLWCSCCAITQEARQLELAYATLHPVVKVAAASNLDVPPLPPMHQMQAPPQQATPYPSPGINSSRTTLPPMWSPPPGQLRGGEPPPSQQWVQPPGPGYQPGMPPGSLPPPQMHHGMPPGSVPPGSLPPPGARPVGSMPPGSLPPPGIVPMGSVPPGSLSRGSYPPPYQQ